MFRSLGSAVGACTAAALSTSLVGVVLYVLLEFYRTWATVEGTTRFGGIVRQAVTGARLVAIEAGFYAIVLAAAAGAVLAALAFARLANTHRGLTLALTLFLVGLVAYPFLGWMSLLNDCAFREGFPLGADCNR